MKTRKTQTTASHALLTSDPHRTVVEDLTETICRFLPDGTFTYANEAYCRFFCIRREELIGLPWHPLVVEADRPLVETRLRMLTPKNPVVVIENRVCDGRGQVRWMQFINRGFFDAQGVLLEMQAVGRDITERVLAEQRLQEGEQRWKFALESSGFGVWDWDITRNTVFRSSQFKLMLGYGADEPVEGATLGWQAMMHPEDLPGTEQAVNDHLMQRADGFAREFRLRCKDGSWKWVMGRGKVIRRDDQQRAMRMTGTLEDISRRNAAEEREAHNLKLIVEGAPCAAVLEAIVRSVEAGHPGMRCSVMLADETGTRLRLQAAPSLPEYVKKALDGMPIAPGIGLCGVATFSGKRVICPDTLADPRLEPFHKLAEKARLLACWSEPVVNGDGNVLGAFACYRREIHAPDVLEIQAITVAARLAALTIEREERKQALHVSEERYERAMRATTDGLWEWNIVTGQTYLSPRWKQMLGFAEGDQLGKDQESFMSRLHPDDWPRVQAERKAHFERRLPYQVELRLCTKNGEYRWFLTRGEADWNERGEAVRMTGTISDITERKQAELNYRRELVYNQALVGHTSAFIVVLDLAGRFVHANASFSATMGYNEEQVIGKTPWEIGLMDAAETVRSKERFARLLRGEKNPSADTRLKTKDGEWRSVELRSIGTCKPDGSLDRIVVTGTDMTERNRLQQEVLRVVEQEQARVGHDLHDGVGQTMTGIVSLLEALEADLQGEPRQQAQRIHELLRQSVSEVRRMSHGLSPTSVKYRGLVGALQLLAETVRTNFRTPCLCEVDAGISIQNNDIEAHLFRIAQEAVNNALRHGKPSEVKLSLQHVSQTECELRIEDDGAGLKKTKGGKSSGIGVRVMDYRANLIGARLTVKAKPRRGVVVSCRFPYEPDKKKR
ncbi:PAS domain S-box protein [Prosthecobacter sp.]|uniref:PAS domain S-box protein n=1 Tax=Prosthecobacter sp. TaxID=1965333 RepID=UPI002488C45E|nr:PAS domain S-box protein [Prosthecobacter sp.]MDI1311126.1 PAS domain S-box protein [Prosthecobacter sp.]